jgi:hypothetical protein
MVTTNQKLSVLYPRIAIKLAKHGNEIVPSVRWEPADLRVRLHAALHAGTQEILQDLYCLIATDLRTSEYIWLRRDAYT